MRYDKGLEFGGEKKRLVCRLLRQVRFLGVMSKAYGLAGIRIGWIASKDTELFKQTC